MTTARNRRRGGLLKALVVLTAALGGAGWVGVAHGQDATADAAIAEKAAVCGGCHGEAGVPIDKSVPVLWGQNEGYIYLQLRDYKVGNRKNEIMSAVVADLEKADLKALAAWFAAKPWPNLQQPRAPADAIARFGPIGTSGQCVACHQDGYVGDGVQPRLAGQGREYLVQTMNDFRSGARANNPWMVALLKTYTDADIDAVASFLAGL